MKVHVKVAAIALAATIGAASVAPPASAFFFPEKHSFWWKYAKKKATKKATKKVVHSGGSSSSTGPIIVGCVMGSAFGLISSALAKKTGELTNEEATLIMVTCGLGAFHVIANLRREQDAN